MSRQILVSLGALVAWTACGGGPADDAGAGDPAGGAESLADSVVGAWIREAGGPEAWSSVRTARYTVTTVWYDSAGRVRRMRPRRVELRKSAAGLQSRIERPEAEGLYVQAYDADTAWATLNARPLPADHPAAEEAEYVARDVYYWFGLPYKLRDPGVQLRGRRIQPGDAPTITGRGGVEVRVSFGSGVGPHPGDRYFYYFLDRNPYPEEVHYIEGGSDSRSRTLWEGFRSAPPLTYVRTRRYVDEAGRRTLELRIDDVSINPGLPDSAFEPPGGSR